MRNDTFLVAADTVLDKVMFEFSDEVLPDNKIDKIASLPQDTVVAELYRNLDVTCQRMVLHRDAGGLLFPAALDTPEFWEDVIVPAARDTVKNLAPVDLIHHRLGQGDR